MGPETEFVVETFGKPKKIRIDPETDVLRFNPKTRVLVAIRRGEQFAEIGQFNEALLEYQKALEVNRNSSLAHYRVAEVFFLQNNYQAAANEFRESLNGDWDPSWTEVWSNINLGKIFDVSGQRERAVNSVQCRHPYARQYRRRTGRSREIPAEAIRAWERLLARPPVNSGDGKGQIARLKLE